MYEITNLGYNIILACLLAACSVTDTQDILNPDLPRSHIESCVWQALADPGLPTKQIAPGDFIPQGGVSLKQYVACDGMLPPECREFRTKRRLLDTMGREDINVTNIAPQGNGRTDRCEIKLRSADLNPMIEEVIKSNQTAEHMRKKRKILNLERYSGNKWTMPIDFAISADFTVEDAAKIRAGFDFWQSETCLIFRELTPATIRSPGIYVQKGGGCSSYVGRMSMANPQPITLSSAYCAQYLGVIAHEIGHALGLWHQHQQPDRDTFINVYRDRIDRTESSKRTNFDAHNVGVDIDFGVAYDMGSVMHYASTAGSNIGSVVLEPVNPLTKLESNMGQRARPSFLDINVVNKAYCDVCTGNNLPICLNDGYPDPRDCTVCKCPPGIGGRTCGRMLGSPGCLPVSRQIWIRDSSTKCVQTPNYIYHDGTRYCFGYYEWDDVCRWRFKSPKGCRLKMWFPYTRATTLKTGFSSCLNWIELKYLGGRHKHNGERICTSPPPYTEANPAISTIRRADVIFEGYNYNKGDSFTRRLGFRLCVKIADPTCLD